MKNEKNFKETHNLTIILIASLCVLFSSQALAIGTKAGRLIQNQGTITYEDINNNSHTVLSSVATFTVKQVYSAQMSSDREKISSASQARG